MDAWEDELPSDDVDREFILSGIRNGFHIVSNSDFAEVECDNYKSAIDPSIHDKVESQIKTEILEGRYVVTPSKPVIVSALGAIQKPGGGIRLIHDASRPLGLALNDYAQMEYKQSFQSLKDAEKLIKPNVYFSKIDLKSAYRSVGIHPEDYCATGLKWKFSGDSDHTYLFDKRLPFGSRLAPGIFHRITQSVRRIMAGYGFHNLVVYLDDFLLVEDSYQKCLLGRNILIQLLRRLGFAIAWEKIVGPSQHIVFLGVLLDSTNCTIMLPKDKLDQFKVLIGESLNRKRWSLKQLQQLAGKLNWASSVVRGGRVYLRRILDLMRPLRNNRHKVRMSTSMREDLLWWNKFLSIFNGVRVIKLNSIVYSAAVDACTTGGGMSFERDWLYVNWAKDYPSLCDSHINVKEAASVLLALKRWGPQWSNSKVVIWSDNKTAVACINKGTSRSREIMSIIREIFWYRELYNITLCCNYLPGVWNVLADSISRLNEVGMLSSLNNSLAFKVPLFNCVWPLYFALHMSYKSFLYLVPQILRWLPSSHC